MNEEPDLKIDPTNRAYLQKLLCQITRRDLRVTATVFDIEEMAKIDEAVNNAKMKPSGVLVFSVTRGSLVWSKNVKGGIRFVPNPNGRFLWKQRYPYTPKIDE